MASFNNYYHHDYPPRPPPPANPNYARERFNNSGSNTSAGGTVVPPSAGNSPPAAPAPNRAPVNRPHTTQPYGGGFVPPPQGFPPVPGQRGSMYGHYPGYAPPYGGGYPPPSAPPMSYAASLPAPPLPVPAGALVPGKPSQGSEDEPTDDRFEKQSLPNASAMGQSDAAVPGMGNQLPDLKALPVEERDKLIGELWGRLQQASAAPKYPPYAPPQAYPPNPYYPHPQYYPPHGGYPQHMPPPLPHESYGYPPPSAPPATMINDQERYSEEPEEKEAGPGSRTGAAPIMPGGYANSPSAETPPLPPPPPPPATKLSRPSTPPKQSTTPGSTPAPAPPLPQTVAQAKKVDVDSRSGSAPPPLKPRNIPTPAPEEQAKPMRMGSTRKAEKEKAKDLGSPSSAGSNPMGPNGQGEIGVIGQMWGVYLFDHDNMKGSLPTPRPKLKSLLRAIANWIIKDIEPKDSLVIPPDKLIKFYQVSKVDDEPFPSGWQDFITSLPPPNLSELFTKLECHHFLIPPPPRPVPQAKEKPSTTVDAYTSYDPIIPALTTIGFEHWMLIQLVAFPDREARRLQKIITEIPLHDTDTNQRFPKFLPRACLPIGADGQVGEWWDETVMSCRKGGYLSNGLHEDDDEDGGYSSEIIHGREPRPYAKSNVASSRGSSRERIEEERKKEREDHLRHQNNHHNHHHDEDQEFVPPALLRKKTDQKYASTQIAFDDLREDPSKAAEIERKRKPYVSVFPPSKGARDILHPPSAGGGTPINPGTRPGGFGDRDIRDRERDRPGSHDTNGSSGSGGYVFTPSYSPTPSASNTFVSTTASSRPGGGGVELHPSGGASSIAGSTATTKAGEYGGVKMAPPGAGHNRVPSIAEDVYNNFKRFGSTSSSTGPTTPGSAHPSSTFSSPQSRNAAAAAAGGQFTPISPMSGGYPELHHYPSVYPHIRGTRLSNIIPPPPPPADLSPPDVTPPPIRPARRRASISAADAAVEYFGGALPNTGGAGNGPRAGGAGDYDNTDRLEYLPRSQQQQQQPQQGYHPHSAHPHHSSHHSMGYYRRDRDRERDRDRDGWDDDEEMFYRGGAERDRERRENGYRDRERDRGRRAGDVDEQEDVVPPPRRRAGRSRPPSEFRDGPGVVSGGGGGGGVGGWGR